MNIYELSKTTPILKDTIDAVERVKKITEKDMRFIWVSDMVAHAKLKAARKSMQHHIVYLHEDKKDNLNHLIVHECYHVYRFWSVPEESRKVMCSTRQSTESRIENWKKEVGAKLKLFPPDMFNMWDSNFMTLLYNAVTDTRIERAMYKEYPGLRKEQLQSLKVMEDEIKRSSAKEVEQLFPKSLFVQVNAINYVFLKQLEPIIGRNWRKTFKGHADILNLGNKLLRAIPEKDEGLNQDIAIINRWASILGTEMGWTDFENIHPGYVEQY